MEVNWLALAVVLGCLVVFLGLSVWFYDPSFGIQQRKAGVRRRGRLAPPLNLRVCLHRRGRVQPVAKLAG